MALTRCRECNNVVSTQAKVCPNCGAPIKKFNSLPGCLTVIVCLIGAIAMAGVITMQQQERDKEAQQEQEAQRVAKMPAAQRAAYEKNQALAAAKAQKKEQMRWARHACRTFVERSLHDPESAQFEDYETYYAEERSNGSYRVQVRVRAKNGFNAMRQTTFNCDTKLVGKDWVALRIEQLGL